jgi:hypothetical protein
MKKLRVLALAVAMALAITACGDDDGSGGDDGFSDEVRSAYMEGCLQDGNQAFCDCTLDEFESRFSEDEFEAIALNFDATAEPPEEFFEVITACLSELEG